MNEVKPPWSVPERAEESIAAILHYLRKEQDPHRRALLMRDYAWRCRELDMDSRAPLHEHVMSSWLPHGYQAGPRYISVQASDVRYADVMMLAVQPIELLAAKQALGVTTSSHEHRQRRFYDKEIPLHAAGHLAEPGSLKVTLTAIGEPLNLHTMEAVGEISEAYRARIWVLVGMAAGIEDEIRKGDVSFPHTVWYYEPGRVQQGKFEPRPETKDRALLSRQLVGFDVTGPALADRLRQALETLPPQHRPPDLDPDFIPKVSVHRDAVASGEKLLRNPDWLRSLHDVNERIILGDQESYGFATACRGVDWMIARGVADYGNPDKDNTWQYLATLMAVHSVLEFLEQDYIPPGLAKDR